MNERLMDRLEGIVHGADATVKAVATCTPARFCSPMDKRVNDSNEPTMKGLYSVVLTDFKTMEEELIGIAIRTERRRADGKDSIMLNFCPWCGTDLRPWRESCIKKSKIEATA